MLISHQGSTPPGDWHNEHDMGEARMINDDAGWVDVDKWDFYFCSSSAPSPKGQTCFASHPRPGVPRRKTYLRYKNLLEEKFNDERRVESFPMCDKSFHRTPRGCQNRSANNRGRDEWLRRTKISNLCNSMGRKKVNIRRSTVLRTPECLLTIRNVITRSFLPPRNASEIKTQRKHRTAPHLIYGALFSGFPRFYARLKQLFLCSPSSCINVYHYRAVWRCVGKNWEIELSEIHKQLGNNIKTFLGSSSTFDSLPTQPTALMHQQRSLWLMKTFRNLLPVDIAVNLWNYFHFLSLSSLKL